MTTQTSHSAGKIAIVFYKGLLALVLAVVSLVSAFSWRNYDALAAIAQDYLAPGEFSLSSWLLKTVLHNQPQDLRFVARIAGIYSLGLGIGAIGFWYGKRWAHILILILASLPLPVELYELIHHPSVHRVIGLSLNLWVVFALFRRLLIAEEGEAPELGQAAEN